MKLSDAYPICKNSINIPFKKLFSNFSTDDIIRNKGKSGQLMEKLCGLQLSNTTTDFEDGELKTSELKESTAITMITDWVDDIIHEEPISFDNSRLSRKIQHIIFMPLVKPSNDPLNWFFKDCFYIPIIKETSLYNDIKKDFENICLNSHELIYEKKITQLPNCKITKNKSLYVKEYGDKFLHTISGKYIQIRTKDAGKEKSKPIYSNKLRRNVTLKSRMAFYFMASFKNYVYKKFK